MKGYLSVFALVAFVGVAPAFAATNFGMGGASAANLNTTTPAVRDNPNVNYQKYETRTTTRTYAVPVRQSNVGYTTTTNNYSMPVNRGQVYYNNNAGSSAVSTYNRSSMVRSQVKRKYYLAHPFFQPTEGKFGMITDISYNTNSYNFGLTSYTTSTGDDMSDTAGKWSTRGFAVKEDLSYGITDRFAVLLMGRFDSTKYKFDWSLPETPDDEMKDSGLNIYGAGVQWRFVDNAEWIADASLYYERQKDVANEFVLDLKGGYKISKSTIYGLGRAWLMLFDEDMYGNAIRGTNINGAEGKLGIIFDDNAKTTLFIEGGLGVFSVLDEDWTLNLEAIYGHYDWHGQASIKAALGWQPNDWFALELYGKTSFYDTAEDKELSAYQFERNAAGGWEQIMGGKGKMDKYKEMSVGGRIIFYF
jgi:hypothetical protein